MDHQYTRFLNDIASERKESLLRLTFNEQSESADMIKMGGGMPNPKLFPIREGSLTLADGRKITLNETLMEEALQYGSSNGYGPLMKQIESLTQRFHAPPCWPNTMMFVTAGSQSGLSLAIEAMISKGDYIIIDSPCYSGILAITDPYKPRYLGVEADAGGMKPESLRSVLSPWNPQKAREATHGVPRFLYTNPNGCNPTGGITTTERRKEIYKIASEYNIIILEDDPYYFIQFRDQKVIISEILKLMGEDGFLEHVKKVQEFYRNQRDKMLDAATKHLSGLCQWDVPAGGMFFWMKVVGVTDTLKLTKKLSKTKQVIVIPGTGFLPHDNQPSPYIRISFSMTTQQEMDEGCRRIAELLKEETAVNK
ncbi:kynurenine/alpha-aminoadipate aminotransferase, mitochondrial-like isoform X2 [Macrobrachium rosenbergii]|uniref:kynurenine/alpha-aminoadipate aminotransferase, mitochondrial-like isoform X2 n=1 Tax=Macrobrachium rosenbergii TaxID=79674 RepID=UPI0034D51688